MSVMKGIKVQLEYTQDIPGKYCSKCAACMSVPIRVMREVFFQCHCRDRDELHGLFCYPHCTDRVHSMADLVPV